MLLELLVLIIATKKKLYKSKLTCGKLENLSNTDCNVLDSIYTQQPQKSPSSWINTRDNQQRKQLVFTAGIMHCVERPMTLLLRKVLYYQLLYSFYTWLWFTGKDVWQRHKSYIHVYCNKAEKCPQRHRVETKRRISFMVRKQRSMKLNTLYIWNKTTTKQKKRRNIY